MRRLLGVVGLAAAVGATFWLAPWADEGAPRSIEAIRAETAIVPPSPPIPEQASAVAVVASNPSVSSSSPVATPPEAAIGPRARLAEIGVTGDVVSRLEEEYASLALEIGELRREFSSRKNVTLEGRELARYRLGAIHRAKLGDDVYDLFLYGAQLPNRVVIESLRTRSIAESAGLKPGDMILRYDQQRIFSTTGLKQVTRLIAGKPHVAMLQVARGGVTIEVQVPRGDLGAQLAAVSFPPPRPKG